MPKSTQENWVSAFRAGKVKDISVEGVLDVVSETFVGQNRLKRASPTYPDK